MIHVFVNSQDDIDVLKTLLVEIQNKSPSFSWDISLYSPERVAKSLSLIKIYAGDKAISNREHFKFIWPSPKKFIVSQEVAPKIFEEIKTHLLPLMAPKENTAVKPEAIMDLSNVDIVEILSAIRTNRLQFRAVLKNGKTIGMNCDGVDIVLDKDKAWSIAFAKLVLNATQVEL